MTSSFDGLEAWARASEATVNQTDIHAKIDALQAQLDELKRQAAAPAETPLEEMRRRYAVLEASAVKLPLSTRKASVAVWDALGDDVIRACGDGTTGTEDANLAALIALVLNRLPQMIAVIDVAQWYRDNAHLPEKVAEAIAELDARHG